MSNLSIQTLGTFQVALAGKPLTDFRTRKVQALLIYLTSEPVPHSRNRLLDLLWPGLPERSARSNLRQILYYLRQDISDGFGDGEGLPLTIANRKNIQLNPQACVEVDTGCFENLLNQTQSHNHIDLFLCPDCRQNLEAAVSLYKGDFLSDFFLDDSNIFEEWAQSRREYFRRRALDALSILTTIHTRRKEYPQARQLAEQQIEIDNLSEGAYRQLMEILALNGRREQALGIYENCRRILAEELGMAPTTRTTELYDKILAGDLDFDKVQEQGVRGYELKELIAEGGHGAVHRAIQPAVGREVAVKVIRRQYADDPDFIRRFEAEAQIVARLEHPHIVPLYDYWRDPNGAYLVMRYMRHGSLLGALESGPWNPPETAALLSQIAGALSTAHQKGVIHRDIKPGNILLDESGNAYLTDFGIAKDLSSQEQITSENAIVGTLDYTSPEQILSGEVTPQSDIYSLGAVIYEILTGEKPFAEDCIANLLHNHLNNPMPLVSATRPDVPAEVDTVLQKATAKKAAERYASPQEMAEAFFAAIGGDVTVRMPESADLLPQVAEIYNPYKGLRAFQEADADDFFGRDALVQQLVDRLDESSSRFLAIIGPSGSGKSSAVKAGLIPALRAGAISGSENWFMAEMVPGSYPLEELELALWPVAVDPPPSLVEPMERDTRGMLRTIRRIIPGKDGSQPQLLLIIDQFEELYTLVEDEERRAFFLDSLLAAIQAPRSPLRVIITLRADFYDRPLLHPEWGQLIKDNTEIVLPLNHSELTWAVREPARRMGVRIEEELIATIVRDVVDQLGALPLLQYALTELFDQREGNVITKNTYDDIGGVQGALGRRAEVIYESLDENGREATRQLFLRLVTLGEGSEDTRRRVLRSELTTLLHNSQFNIHNSLLETVLDSFGTARLLTFDRDPGTRGPTVEVAHEALLREWSLLRRWLEESRDDVRRQRQLAAAAQEWSQVGQDASFLLLGTRLDFFTGWAAETTIALTGQEQAYLDASVLARKARRAEEETRRQRELETARQLAETERQRAAEQARFAQQQQQLVRNLSEAYSQSLAVHAQKELDDKDTATALALALEANKIENPPPFVQRILRETAYAPGPRRLYQVANLFPDVDGRIYSLAGSPVAQEALIGFEDGTLILWNIDSESERLRLAGHTGIVYSIAFSPDGQTALSGAADRAVILWDLATGDEIRRFEGHAGWVRTVAFSPDGETAVSGGFTGSSVPDLANPGQLILWDLNTGQEIRRFEGQPSGVVAAAFTPDGQAVVSSSGLWSNVENEYSLVLWDVTSGEKIHDFAIAGGNSDNSTMAISPDGQTVLTGNSTNEVLKWDLNTGQKLAALQGHIAQNVTSVVFTLDGRRALSGDANGMVILWDLASAKPLMQTVVQQPVIGGWHQDDSPLLNLALNSDGRTALSSAGDGTLMLWDLVDAGEIRRFAGHESLYLLSAVFTPDGQRVLTSEWGDAFQLNFGSSTTMHLWDVATGEKLRSFEGHTAGIIMIAVSPDGRQALTGSQDGTIRLWDLETGAERQQILAHTGGVFAVAFSPDGHLAVSASVLDDKDDSGITLWDLQSGERIRRFATRGHFTELVISQDEQFLYSPVYEQDKIGIFGLFNVETGQLIRIYHTPKMCTGFALHPNGRSVFFANNAGGPVYEWDLENDREIRSFGQHPGARTRVKVSPDGRLLLVSAGSFEGGIFSLWDLETGEQIRGFRGDGFCCIDFDMSPDGTMAVSPGGSGTAILWDLTLPIAIDDMLAWLDANRYVRPLTCAERELYSLEPCE